MSNEKQTAVQNLCMKLANKLGIPQAITFYVDYEQEILEALEMEKEQIEEAYKYARAHWSREDGNAERYYNETYGGNK
jgi:uncharacterized protein (DUF433 family)